MLLALRGELGSGKTCFVQGLARAMGVREPVTSPTFTLVNEYQGRHRKLFHADWYRLSNGAEVDDLGLEEALAIPAVIAIEWPERALEWFPSNAVTIRFAMGQKPNERMITRTPGP